MLSSPQIPRRLLSAVGARTGGSSAGGLPAPKQMAEHSEFEFLGAPDGERAEICLCGRVLPRTVERHPSGICRQRFEA